MRFVIAADHAGFELKNLLLEDLQSAGIEVEDLGAHEYDAQDDYPDYAERVANALAKGEAQRGIVLCGSGVGVCVAINKYRGTRAAVCHDTYSARQGVEHDDMNVLCMGSRIVGSALAREVARAFAQARFSDEERHRRRLAKVRSVEERHFRD